MAEKTLDPEMVRIGATIKALREARGLKADELANAIPISRPYLMNIEAGRKRLSPVYAVRIAQILDVRPISILRSDEFPPELLAEAS